MAGQWLPNDPANPPITNHPITEYPNSNHPNTNHPNSSRPNTTVARLDVPGVALALQLSSPKSKRSTTQQVETQLYFEHPSGIPFIVNMVVYITATVQVTADLLKMVDWHNINHIFIRLTGVRN